MLEKFSATIEKLYAAAGDATRWGEALAAIEQLTGSAGAVVHIVPKVGSERLVTLLGTSAAGSLLREHVEEWTRDYAPLCPRLAAASRWPNAPYLVDYMLMSERELDFDPVYDWYGAYGLRYFIGSRLYQDDEVEVVWSLQRRREQGHVQQPDVALFESLKPHIARALTLARQLGTLGSFARFTSAVLESLPQAVFALDDDGRIRFANDRARQLLEAADGLGSEDGHLKAAFVADRARLDMLIRDANGLPMSSGGWSRVERPSGRLPYALFVAPLINDDDELLASECRVLVVVHDFANASSVDPQMLRSLYGLTNTEARLACAITSGHSLESAATSLQMQIATARSHLKSIFAKVGVHRQQDLVGRIASLSSIRT
jgi:DNA-binding CsgD family transcriptional regulator/PAS domain-containing protein